VWEVPWHREVIKAAEIGSQLRFDKVMLSGILNRMIEAEWLIKEQELQDRRMFQLFFLKMRMI
jgi:DNA-binding MarR family transcriptional regulator